MVDGPVRGTLAAIGREACMSLAFRAREFRLWLVLPVAAAILVLALAVDPSVSAAEERAPGAPVVEIASAAGGVSDSSLAAAIFIPGIFLFATVALLLRVRTARAKPAADENTEAKLITGAVSNELYADIMNLNCSTIM